MEEFVLKKDFIRRYWGQEIAIVSRRQYQSYILQENLHLIRYLVLRDIRKALKEDLIEVTIKYINTLFIDVQNANLTCVTKIEKYLDKYQIYYKYKSINEKAPNLHQDGLCYGHTTISFNCNMWNRFELDFFLSKGYAIDWREYTIEDQIEKGWIRLIK